MRKLLYNHTRVVTDTASLIRPQMEPRHSNVIQPPSSCTNMKTFIVLSAYPITPQMKMTSGLIYE